MISIRSSSSRRTVPTHRSANAFARGAPTGVRKIRMPSEVKMASKVAVNFASRSRIKNLNCPMRSARSMSRLRACWATVDRAAPSTDLHQGAREVGDALQGQAGHVGRAGEAVEGAVEVGAGVGLKGTETRDSGFMQPVRTQD